MHTGWVILVGCVSLSGYYGVDENLTVPPFNIGVRAEDTEEYHSEDFQPLFRNNNFQNICSLNANHRICIPHLSLLLVVIGYVLLLPLGNIIIICVPSF